MVLPFKTDRTMWRPIGGRIVRFLYGRIRFKKENRPNNFTEPPAESPVEKNRPML